MEIEAPSAPTVSTPIAVGPSVEAGLSPFSGPEISSGGAFSPSAPNSPLDFGPQHQLSGEIFSQDKAIYCPENIFDQNLFETVAKTNPPETPSQPWAGLKTKPATLGELFGPQIEVVKIPSSDYPVAPADFELLVTEERFGRKEVAVELSPASAREVVFLSNPTTSPTIKVEVKTVEEVKPQPAQIEMGAFQPLPQELVKPIESIHLPKVEKEEGTEGAVTSEAKPSGGRVSPREEVIIWVDPQKKKGELEEEEEMEEKAKPGVARKQAVLEKDKEKVAAEVEVAPQVSVAQSTEDGRSEVLTEGEEAEEEEPQEPLWEASGKKEEGEGIDKIVLERRLNVASGIVEAVSKEVNPQAKTDKYGFVRQVAARLGEIDVPTFEEALRIIFRRLHFPPLARIAGDKVKRLKENELEPAGILRSLNETLAENPPLKPQAGKMEYEGFLPESQLGAIEQEVVELAHQGAKHIVFDPVCGWRKVKEKPFQYPLELDKTKKIVPQKAVDSPPSLWYTLFTQRAEARARRKKADLNEKNQDISSF